MRLRLGAEPQVVVPRGQADLDLLELAEHAAAGQLGQPDVDVDRAILGGGLEDPLVLGDRLAERDALGMEQGERLLADHVLAALRRHDRGDDVPVIGRVVGDDIDVLAQDQLAEVAVGGAGSVALAVNAARNARRRPSAPRPDGSCPRRRRQRPGHRGSGRSGAGSSRPRGCRSRSVRPGSARWGPSASPAERRGRDECGKAQCGRGCRGARQETPARDAKRVGHVRNSSTGSSGRSLRIGLVVRVTGRILQDSPVC